MKPFVHYNPVKIVFGAGSIDKLPEYIEEARRTVVVTGKASANLSGLADRIRAILAENGVERIEFRAAGSNPSISEVNKIAEIAINMGASLVIGVGGGSAMDAAKAAAAVATNPGPFRSLIGKKRIDNNPLPFILVPTTAGTGSEVNQYAIINNDEGTDKLNLSGENTYAHAAILDPELSISMPKEITVDTGIDALSHAIEGYISRRAMPLSDTLAPAVFSIIREALPIAFNNPSNIDARGRMLYAASLAGMIISHTGTTMVHALGYALTLNFGVSHGRANAALIAHGLRLNYNAAPERIGEIYRLFGGGENSSGVQALLDFLHSLGVKTRLRDYGVGMDSLETFKKYVMARANVRNSPADISEADMAGFLDDIY